MTHDPLCPFAEWPEESCYQRDAGVSICALIARVRADEREMSRERIFRDGPWCDKPHYRHDERHEPGSCLCYLSAADAAAGR